MFDDPSERLPVQDPEFWKKRLLSVVATGRDLHKAIYNIDYVVWEQIQNRTRDVLAEYVRPGDRMLDAGCGIGSLLDVTDPRVFYTGIDVSPHLIEIAKERNPTAQFLVEDASNLSWCTDGFFDWVVCRSVKRMMLDNLPPSEWDSVERELRRVGKNVMILEYRGISVSVEVIQSCR